ncbi:MAG: adenine nucleotide alpha hydrolase [Fimbriimonas sp.]|nr:adenine nucleotide alpha hydrolase [Fimbriimonas sp.]
MTKAYLSWSSGKDSAFAFIEAQRQGDVEVVGLITTISETYDRVVMHGVRHSLLDCQVQRLGVPCLKVPLPADCTMEVYESRMDAALKSIKMQGIDHVVYGDLFLEDVRGPREVQLAKHGMTGVFPLWQRGTPALASEMIESGIVAHLVCVDPKKLDASFAGRAFDRSLLADLPSQIDPCGEYGEFHTVVSAGPMFSSPIPVHIGPVVERGGFVFADAQAVDEA